jgi:hypothetical protein
MQKLTENVFALVQQIRQLKNNDFSEYRVLVEILRGIIHAVGAPTFSCCACGMSKNCSNAREVLIKHTKALFKTAEAFGISEEVLRKHIMSYDPGNESGKLLLEMIDGRGPNEPSFCWNDSSGVGILANLLEEHSKQEQDT